MHTSTPGSVFVGEEYTQRWRELALVLQELKGPYNNNDTECNWIIFCDILFPFSR